MYPQRSVMTCGLATALEPPHFNHAPVRGAIGAIQYVAGYVTKFQSTHPRGVRRDGQPPDCRCGDVSIHAPAWGATRTRRVSAPKPEPVSIHAPAWGATPVVDAYRGHDAGVSIHAPAWGATRPLPRPAHHAAFQSTHPRGVRLRSCGESFRGCAVSIHAPAWGAT